MSGLETLVKGDDSRVVEPRRFVARNQAMFTAIWAAHAGPESAAPAVNFDTHMVAAVFAGERPTPGFEIAISNARKEGNALLLVVDEHVPDPRLAAAQVIVSPFHIVTLPRHDGEIRYSGNDEHLPHTTLVFKAQTTHGAHAPVTSTTLAGAPSRAARTAVARARSSEPLQDPSSSTGLTPQVAATLAYLAGPFSGALLLATERTDRFVRFHAWQALLGLGVLGSAAVLALILAFVMLIASPTAFWVMLWLAAIAAVAWVAAWGICLVQAYRGRTWKLPLAGDYAERYAAR
jgi:uncharacterized membrane protein